MLSVRLAPRLLVHTGLALLACYAIFRLPYHFPPAVRLRSDSYVFGFNNTVAIASLVVWLLLLTLLRLLPSRGGGSAPRIQFRTTLTTDHPRLSYRDYAAAAAIYAGLTLALYWMASGAPTYSIDWESSHFLWRLRLMELYGLRPYLDFNFEYGPALLYPPLILHRLFTPLALSLEASYYLCHYALALLGLFCAFSILNHAVMPLPYKRLVFFIVALASFTPYMGLNGLSLRYLMPYWGLLVVHQVTAGGHNLRLAGRSRLTVAVIFVSLTAIQISPEIGIAFCVALLAYSVLGLRTSVTSTATLLVALVVTLVVSYLVLPEGYYATMLRFSGGANNFPLLPALHILLYLVIVSFAIPRLLVTALLPPQDTTPLLFAFGVLSLTLMPGALGRCDPPHVLLYGLGISLITFILLSYTAPSLRRLYVGAYVCVFIIGFHLSNARVFYEASLTDLGSWRFLHAAAHSVWRGATGQTSSSPDGHLAGGQGGVSTAARLAALDKYPALGLPFGTSSIDKPTEHYLWAHKKIEPEYYAGNVAIYTDKELTRKLGDLSSHEYILIPRDAQTGWNVTCADRRRYMRLSFVYPVTLPCHHEGLDPDAEIARHLATSHRVVEESGPYLVMKRNH